jgi:ssDNA-binding Zn-finger/Zn-ribbon topoisomerase 1
MALINCKECGAEVSSEAYKCPKCGLQLRKAKRGFFGKIIKWLFIGFNLLMLFWLISYMGTVGEAVATGNEAESTGAAIGGTIGTGMLMSIWVFGDIILGLLVLFTRPKEK